MAAWTHTVVWMFNRYCQPTKQPFWKPSRRPWWVCRSCACLLRVEVPRSVLRLVASFLVESCGPVRCLWLVHCIGASVILYLTSVWKFAVGETWVMFYPPPSYSAPLFKKHRGLGTLPSNSAEGHRCIASLLDLWGHPPLSETFNHGTRKCYDEKVPLLHNWHRRKEP